MPPHTHSLYIHGTHSVTQSLHSLTVTQSLHSLTPQSCNHYSLALTALTHSCNHYSLALTALTHSLKHSLTVMQSLLTGTHCTHSLSAHRLIDPSILIGHSHPTEQGPMGAGWDTGENERHCRGFCPWGPVPKKWHNPRLVKIVYLHILVGSRGSRHGRLFD